MACLAKTMSGCSGHAVKTFQLAQGRTVSPSNMIRIYGAARLGKSLGQGCLNSCLIGLGNGELRCKSAMSSALGLDVRVRRSPRLSFAGASLGSLSFSSCSDGVALKYNDSRKHPSTVECMSSDSAGDRDNSMQRRRRQNLEKLACPGCGVYMQDKDPNKPGYFKMPATILAKSDDEFDEGEEEDDGELEIEDNIEDLERDMNEAQDENNVAVRGELEEVGWDSDEDDQEDLDLSNVEISDWNELGGNKQGAKDAWAEVLGGRRGTKRDAARNSTEEEEEEEKVVVCARCHTLRNYGKVKDESMENLLPDFDFERVVGARLKKAYGRRAVVLMVVDGSDFDGSFPRKAAEVVAEADQELGTAWQEGKAGNTPRLLVVLNKIDLLPRQVSPNRLEHWVRRRSKAGGVSRLAGVHLVSAFKGWGIEQLAENIKQLAGPRGDCWVVGAQNAGKSSLINSLAKYAGEKRQKTGLTEAAVPGTTLGVLKLEGILPARARLFDTPGLIHPYQLSTRLNREEQKLVQVRKELKPRTFRVMKGSTVHVGGLLRLDVVDAPSESIYVTVWASAQLPCHMGKSEKAEELFEKHIGDRLKPPLNKERAVEIGRWVPRRVTVTGNSWQNSSVDVAVAGLGWVGIGVKGTAILQAWTYEGVAVTTHEAMVYDMAAIFEKAGFTAMKAPSKGDKKSKDKPKVAKVRETVF